MSSCSRSKVSVSTTGKCDRAYRSRRFCIYVGIKNAILTPGYFYEVKPEISICGGRFGESAVRVGDLVVGEDRGQNICENAPGGYVAQAGVEVLRACRSERAGQKAKHECMRVECSCMLVIRVSCFCGLMA